MIKEFSALLRHWIVAGLGGAVGCGVGGAFADELTGFDCLIEPHSLVEVSTREEGVIQTLRVQRGDLVKKGQAIAELDADVEEAAVNLARARAELKAEIEEREESLAFAKRELRRVDELQRGRAASVHEKDEATTAAKRAELQLRQAVERQELARLELLQAQRLLQRRTIYSPVDGVVVETELAPGESVENHTIMQLAEVDPLNVEIIVPVEYFGAIALGARAAITPKYPGAEVLTATVVVVDRVVDAASDTFGVRLELPNPGYEIPGGVRCDVRFLSAAN